jgi:hypothetical protein
VTHPYAETIRSAAHSEPDPRDELVERLKLARQWGGRGNLRQRREMWRFCARAFREWSGMQYLMDAPIVSQRPLTVREMLAWLQLAQEMPAVARSVLEMQKDAAADNKRMALRVTPWSPERRLMLIELHQCAIQMAAGERDRAQKSAEAASKMGHGHERSIQHRIGILAGIERWQIELSEQLQALKDAGKCDPLNAAAD